MHWQLLIPVAVKSVSPTVRPVSRPIVSDPRTGRLTGSTLYQDLDGSGKIRGWIYSVHVGSWGGLLTRILWFLAALLGATLPLTGYYLWIKRIGRKRPAA